MAEAVATLPQKDLVRNAVLTLVASNEKRKAARILWPWFVQNEQTERIWAALDDYPYLAIMGHAAASKTFTCAAWFLLDWWQDFENTSLILTSDTIASMNRRIWTDIKTLFSKASVTMPGILVDSKRMIQYSPLDQKNAIAGIAAESDDSQSKIQGLHTKRVRVLIDEADNKLSRSIWGAIANLGASGDIKVVALANPADRLGEFGRHCEPIDGWPSINPEADYEWESRQNWHVLRLDGLRSPNIMAGKDIYPFLLTVGGMAAIRDQKGELSPEWWAYVRAWYPPSGSIRSIFSPEIIEKMRPKIVWYSDTIPIASCDPAFEGGDDCILCLGRMGRLASNPRQTAFEANTFLKILRSDKDKPITIDFGDQIIAILKNANVKPENFTIDCTGNALGLSDYIQHKWQAAIMPVNFGGSPTKMKITTEDTKKACDQYDRFVSELCYTLREWTKLGLVHIPKPPRELNMQLESRLYELMPASQKIRVETKTKMKERGIGSPDYFDALSLLCHLARSRSQSGTPGLASPQGRYDPLKPFRKAASRFNATYGVPDKPGR